MNRCTKSERFSSDKEGETGIAITIPMQADYVQTTKEPFADQILIILLIFF